MSAALLAAATVIASTIEDVDRRAMASDGNVPPTLAIITAEELLAVYEAARAIQADALAHPPADLKPGTVRVRGRDGRPIGSAHEAIIEVLGEDGKWVNLRFVHSLQLEISASSSFGPPMLSLNVMGAVIDASMTPDLVRFVSNDKAGFAAFKLLLSQAGWSPTHVHLKSGKLVKVLFRGRREADLEPVVIYEEVGVPPWVRPATEFDDGRFEELPGE